MTRSTRGRRRLRVAVPAGLAAFSRASGVGKMWREVLPRLAESVKVAYVDDPGKRRAGRLRRPDVWLSDGHQGPLAVEEPRVVQLHEASLHMPELRAMIEAPFIQAVERPSREAALDATRIITPSESSRRQVLEAYGVDPGRVVAVPHGVDRRVFRPGLDGGQEVIVRAGGRRGAPYVLFVSQIHHRKNFGALRTAMAGLATRDYPHLLVLIGAAPADRPDPSELMAEAAAELPGAPGRVVLLQGLRETEVAAVMSGCAAFCLPSLMEGFGLPVLEAMACGVPVIVSDRGSLPEVVDGAGIVVSPEPEPIEAALAEVLGSPDRARALGRTAAERAARFDWERTAEGWLHVLEEAVEAGR